MTASTLITQRLGDFFAMRDGAVDPSQYPDEVFDLYSIPAFDAQAPEVLPGKKIGSTKQIVRPGDVLLSKIVPHIRRAWVVGESRGRRIIASGEWLVFRGDIDPDYLRLLLIADEFHRQFMKTVSGVGGSLKRAIPSDVMRIEIQLPCRAEQKRIAEILREQLAAVERAADSAEAQLKAAQALPAAYLREVFEGNEAGSWPRIPIKQLLTAPLRTGISKPTDSLSHSRCLTLSAVRDGKILLKESKPSALTLDELAKYSVTPGAFYIVRGNGNRTLVGRAGRVPPTDDLIAFPDLLIEFFPDSERILPEFFRYGWDCHEVRADIEERSRTAAGIYKINLRNLTEVVVPTPTLAKQEQIAAQLTSCFEAASSLMNRCRDGLGSIEALPQAMLREAFQGRI